MNPRSVVMGLLILTAGLPGWLPCQAQAPGSKVWEFPTGAGVVSSPALGRDGTVYIGSTNGTLYALDGATGVKRWEFQTGNAGVASPSVDDDGVVFVGSSTARVYALDGGSGGKLWEFATAGGVLVTPAIAANGTVYVLGYYTTYALDGATGTKLWEYPFSAGYSTGSCPGLLADGTIVVGIAKHYDQGGLFGLDGTTGRLKWFVNGEGSLMGSSSPAVGSDDAIYFGKPMEYFWGKPRSNASWWLVDIPHAGFNSSPAIGGDGTVYVGAAGTPRVYAFGGTTGAKRWEFVPGGDVSSSPALAADGTVYVGCDAGRLYALDGVTGVKLWEFATGARIYSSPVIAPDGTVYVGSMDGSVYALKGSSPLAPSPWPLRGANAQRTGRKFLDGTQLALVTPPRSQRKLNGDDTWFRVRCEGAFPRSYQWFYNGVALTDATNATLGLRNVQGSQAGAYRVTVSNSYNSVTSAEVLLAVVGAGAPEIRADGELLITPGTVKRGNRSVLTLSSTLTSAQMFYTIDGSAPTFASLKYTGPLTVSNTTTVRAVAYSSDFSQSPTDGPVVIQIVPAYTVSTQIAGQGTVALSPAQGPYLQGASVTATATPAAGWRFARWQGDLSGAPPSGTLTMDANKTITAVFEAIPQYPLAAFTAGGGKVEGNTASPYYGGTTVEVRAVAANGWQFLYWRGDGSGNTTNLTVTMDQAKSVEAVFGTPVSAVAAGPGAVTLTPAAGPYPYGSTVVVSGVPQPGNYLALWGDAASGSANPLFFVVTNPTPRISGLFAAIPPNQVLLTVSVVGEGTVTLDPPRTIFSVGEVVTLSAVPALDYTFSGWSGDSNSLASILKVTMQQDTQLTATFSLAAPTIAMEPEDQPLPAGADARFVVRALGGQPLAYRWRKDGAELTDADRISGTASSTLVVANLGLADVGGYTVVVTNTVGSVTSRVAALSIPQNLVLPANGGRLEQFGSQYNDSTWAATNLTDGVARGAGFEWASQKFPSKPHEFVFSFQDHRAAEVSSIRVFTAGDGGRYYSKDIAFYASDDRIAWSFITNGVLPWADDVKLFSFKPVVTRHVAAVISSGYDIEYWELGEIEVYGQLLDSQVTGLQQLVLPANGGRLESFTSQYNNSTWAAANLTDGVPHGAGFGWASQTLPVAPQEFVYSFKDHRAAAVSTIRVFTCGESGLHYGKDIAFYGSVDGTVWSGITNGVLQWFDDVKIFSFKPATARYVKAVLSSGYDRAYWELGEIEVYGKLLDPPAITLQPQSQAVTVGASPNFSVNATGLAPLAYQWQHDGTPIALGTNATLALSQVTVKDAGVYRVVVSNPGGSVTSDPATLTVNKGAAVVTLAGLSQVYDGTPKTVTATTTPPGLKVGLSYDGGSTGPVNAGIHSVTATIADDNYSGSASGILVIAQAGQTITFGPLSPKLVGDAPFTLGATASSGLPVAYSSSHPEVASVLGSVLTIQSAGTTAITAAQAGDGNYQAAAEVTQALVVTAPVPPQFAPGAMGLTQTGFRVVFTGTLGVSYVLEVSENLRQWTQLTQVVAGSGQTIVIDPNAVGKRQRYYRLRTATP